MKSKEYYKFCKEIRVKASFDKPVSFVEDFLPLLKKAFPNLDNVIKGFERDGASYLETIHFYTTVYIPYLSLTKRKKLYKCKNELLPKLTEDIKKEILTHLNLVHSDLAFIFRNQWRDVVMNLTKYEKDERDLRRLILIAFFFYIPDEKHDISIEILTSKYFANFPQLIEPVNPIEASDTFVDSLREIFVPMIESAPLIVDPSIKVLEHMIVMTRSQLDNIKKDIFFPKFTMWGRKRDKLMKSLDNRIDKDAVLVYFKIKNIRGLEVKTFNTKNYFMNRNISFSIKKKTQTKSNYKNVTICVFEL